MDKIRSYLILCLIMGLININCGNKTQDIDKSKLTAMNEVPVQIDTVRKKEISVIKNFTGTLEGEQQANVVSKIQERINSVNVKIGDVVKPGKVLVSLDKSGASSQFYQAKAGFENAAQNLDRMKALYAAGAIAKQMLDGAQTTYDISKANYDAAKSMVELASPISGIVTFIDCNIGDLALPGKVILTVASINKMKILFTVNEQHISALSLGKMAEIFSEQRPDLVQYGSISQVSRSADIQSRSFDVRAVFPNNSDRWFKPGMFCRVNVIVNHSNSSLIIPTKAIIFLENKKGVFVIENNIASFRLIETGMSNAQSTEVIRGLKEWEKVVTLGMNNLKEGSKIILSNI